MPRYVGKSSQCPNILCTDKSTKSQLFACSAYFRYIVRISSRPLIASSVNFSGVLVIFASSVHSSGVLVIFASSVHSSGVLVIFASSVHSSGVLAAVLFVSISNFATSISNPQSLTSCHLLISSSGTSLKGKSFHTFLTTSLVCGTLSPRNSSPSPYSPSPVLKNPISIRRCSSFRSDSIYAIISLAVIV